MSLNAGQSQIAVDFRGAKYIWSRTSLTLALRLGWYCTASAREWLRSLQASPRGKCGACGAIRNPGHPPPPDGWDTSFLIILELAISNLRHYGAMAIDDPEFESLRNCTSDSQEKTRQQITKRKPPIRFWRSMMRRSRGPPSQRPPRLSCGFQV